jgi:hypothetical protein
MMRIMIEPATAVETRLVVAAAEGIDPMAAHAGAMTC